MTPQRHTGSEGLNAFARYLKVQCGLAEGTIKAYRHEAEDWFSYLDRTEEPSVRQWSYDREGEQSASTVTRRLSALKRLAKFLNDAELLAEVEAEPRPKRRQGLPRPVKDLPAVLKRMDPLTRAMAVFLAQTGLRIHEAYRFELLDSGEEILVTGKGGKDRIVPLTDKAKAALNYLGGRFPINIRAVQRRFSQYGFTPHQLRHWRATSLVEAGADIGAVQKLLGHASAQTTTVYAAYAPKTVRRALDLAG